MRTFFAFILFFVTFEAAANNPPPPPEPPSPPRPVEVSVSFTEADFHSRPWLRDFQYVVVINKAISGKDRQSIRIYKQQRLVSSEEVSLFLETLNQQDQQILIDLQKKMLQDPKNKSLKKQMKEVSERLEERSHRQEELPTQLWQNSVFKVSTGRDAFEKKGEHHSQKDNWTITPTGFYYPQAFRSRHKSESYSHSLCDSAAGQFLSAILKKELCTMMDYALFFNGGIALHQAIPGTEKALGEKASGGCVRLPGALAQYLFYNLNQALGSVPILQTNGNPALDEYGRMIVSKKLTSSWGTIDARSVLIIVQNKN